MSDSSPFQVITDPESHDVVEQGLTMTTSLRDSNVVESQTETPDHQPRSESLETAIESGQDTNSPQVEVVISRGTSDFATVPPELSATVMFSAMQNSDIKSDVIRAEWNTDVGTLLEKYVHGQQERHQPCDEHFCQKSSSSHAECTICVENILPGQEATNLPCRHVFHHSCISEWLNSKLSNGVPGRCPNCNRDIVLPSNLPPPKDEYARSPALDAYRGSSVPPPRNITCFGYLSPVSRDQVCAALVLVICMVACVVWLTSQSAKDHDDDDSDDDHDDRSLSEQAHDTVFRGGDRKSVV